MKFIAQLGLLFFILLLANCSGGGSLPKFADDSPFKETGVESTLFEFDASRDTFILGPSGTRVFIPAGSLVKSGTVYAGKARLELAEAYSIEDIMRSGLSTETEDGKLLKTKGMAYLKFTAGETELSPAEEIKPRVEMPVSGDLDGFGIYKGVAGKDGKVLWADKVVPKKYLTPVPASELDFLPDEFADSCRANYKLLGWNKPEMENYEKLYASLINWKTGQHYEHKGFEMNEDVLTGKHHIENVYANGSYAADSSETMESPLPDINCKSWPAWVLELKKPKYKNTFLHTRAMEERIRAMIQGHKTDLIKIYVSKLQDDLWTIDEVVAKDLKNKSKDEILAQRFKAFSDEKLTNVKNLPKSISAYALAFQLEVEKNNDKIKKLSEKLNKKTEKNTAVDNKIVEEYKQVLEKREAYRMTTLGYEFSGNGWYNVDAAVVSKCTKFIDEKIITIDNPAEADVLFVYAIVKDIKSLARLEQKQRGEFHTAGLAATADENCNPRVDFVTLGLKGKQWYVGDEVGDHSPASKSLHYNLHAADATEMNKLFDEISLYTKGGEDFNSIKKDLEFQQTVYKQAQENFKNRRKWDLMDNLEYLGFIECYGGIVTYVGPKNTIASDKENGFQTFGAFAYNVECAKCHGIEASKINIANIRKKYPVGWLSHFMQNSEHLVKLNEPWAVAVKNISKEGVNHTLSEGVHPDYYKNIIYFLEHIPENWNASIEVPSKTK